MKDSVHSLVYTLKDTWDLEGRQLEQEDFQTVLRAAGETETTQENIQDWLQLDEGEPGFQLLTEKDTAAVIFFIYFHQHYLHD
jgi:hypothetical protein